MKKFLLLIATCFIFMGLSAQSKVLQGLVVDSKDEPLIGASVRTGDNQAATITNVDGKFSLTLPAKATSVTVSYVGFNSKTVNIENESDIKVVLLEGGNILNEAVVVGYGVQKKATMTGAVSAASGDVISKRSLASMSTALQGVMPGVTVQQTSGEPGADASSIRIRGIGSIGSSQDPLVLVDGIEMNMNQVDMSTVESISVLKDAASASIYGSRASNGVVLITTKRGQEGKVRVGYNGYLTIQRPTNLPEVVGGADYLEGVMNSKINGRDGSMTPDQIAKNMAEIDAYRKFQPDNWSRYDADWKNATISKSALMQNHSVNISGGSSSITYFGALGYLGQDGLIKNNNFNRLNVRINTDAKLTSWIKLSNEVAYRRSKQVTPSISTAKAIINKSLYMAPTLSAVKELDGHWGYGKNGDNPTAQAEDGGTKKIYRPEILLNTTLTLTPLAGLELQAQYSWRKEDVRSTNIIKPYLTSIRGLVQGQYPGLDGVSESLSENKHNNYRLQASYGRVFDKHNTNILFGFQAEDHVTTSMSASKTGFDIGKHYLDNGDGSTAGAGGGANQWSMASLYGRLNYDFDSKYLLEFSGRYDGSSRFSKKNRWGFFPGISAGWVMSEESFMKDNTSWLDHFKLRASYGELGNADLVDSYGNRDYYPYAALVETGYSYWLDKTLSTGVAQVNFANPNISWETSSQTNFGLDAVMFDQQLTVSFDYFIKKVSNMLQKFPLPYYVGLGSPFRNAGDMENKGWEIATTYRKKIDQVNFSVTATLSDVKNKVTDLKGRIYTDNSVKEGYPNGGYWGYLTDGYLQDMDDVNNSPLIGTVAYPGYIKYVKAGGTDPKQMESTDKVYLGDPFPHYEYGLRLDANWKGFDCSVFIQGVGKRDVMLKGIGLIPFYNGSNLFTHQMDSWTEDNRNAAYPILLPEANSAASNFTNSDKWIKSGAYTRLKNVVVGYTLPRNVIRKLKIENVRVYASGQNLFTISKFYKGYDPEVQYGGSLGGEFYPIMQTFTFGVDFKF